MHTTSRTSAVIHLAGLGVATLAMLLALAPAAQAAEDLVCYRTPGVPTGTCVGFYGDDGVTRSCTGRECDG